jgi:Tol biopolymer transport system component
MDRDFGPLENHDANNAEMTPQALERVFDLFLACREMDAEPREIWLREACQGNLSLQRSVEALVREDENAEGFLSQPMRLVTRAFSFVIEEGQRFGRYTITGFVGRGGMGEVWKAHDEELDRAVALKFINSGFTEALLTREARMASALNHPGIVTVHDVIVWEETPILVMELVTGTPLSRFCDGLIPVDQLASLAAQASSALAAAHAAGIIHGDLKPDNIIWRDDRLAKILDFGLARKVDNAAVALAAGTPLYMSPEQARGETAGTAADVYSLGLVLYELATGQRPFGRQSLEEIGARQAKPPRALHERPGLTQALDALIDRMLEPDPASRISMTEVAEQLRLERPAPPGYTRFWLFAAVVAVAVVLGIIWFNWRVREQSAPIALTAIPLTAGPGFYSWPDISLDGDEVVYGWGESEDAYTQIYRRRLDQDTAFRLMEAERGTRIGHPKWSSDGQRIFYKRTSVRPGDAESIWSVARDGKDPRLIVRLALAELSSGIDCSPDGKRIIYGDRTGNDRRFAILSLDLASGRQTVLTTPQVGWGDWDPRYSPDGEKIVFKRVKTPGDDRLYVMPAKGGAVRQLTSRRCSIFGHAWLSQDKLLVSAQFGSVIHGLWRISADVTGEQTPVFESGFDATMPAVSKNRIVWVNRVNDYNIYSVPLAGGEPVKRIASPMLDSKPAFARDGRLAYVSRRSGSPEVWITGADGGNAVRITNLKGDVGRPAWSPDGARIAFSNMRFGIVRVLVANCTPAALNCESPKPVVDGTSPTWSPDGNFLYFTPPEQQEIWKLPLSGGQPMHVAAGYQALTSHDGKWLYIPRIPADGRGKFCRIRLDSHGNATGSEEMVLGRETNSANWQHWTLAGDEIVFWDSNMSSRFSGLRAYHTVTKRLRTVVETPAAEFPAVSPDGKTVWYAKPDAAGGTLMVAEWSH